MTRICLSLGSYMQHHFFVHVLLFFCCQHYYRTIEELLRSPAVPLPSFAEFYICVSQVVHQKWKKKNNTYTVARDGHATRITSDLWHVKRRSVSFKLLRNLVESLCWIWTESSVGWWWSESILRLDRRDYCSGGLYLCTIRLLGGGGLNRLHRERLVII
jgi:hypothetical protein